MVYILWNCFGGRKWCFRGRYCIKIHLYAGAENNTTWETSDVGCARGTSDNLRSSRCRSFKERWWFQGVRGRSSRRDDQRGSVARFWCAQQRQNQCVKWSVVSVRVLILKSHRWKQGKEYIIYHAIMQSQKHSCLLNFFPAFFCCICLLLVGFFLPTFLLIKVIHVYCRDIENMVKHKNE